MGEERKGLVLEGGGMRGLYTAGVLDVFLEEGIRFDGVLGVSAGAIHGGSYASGQRGRSIRYYRKYLTDKRFMGWYCLLTTGEYVGNDFCYHDIPEKLDPFDNEAFMKQGIEFYAGITCMETGKAEYRLVTDMRKEVDIIRASATLPYVSRPVILDGKHYMDGGCSDSIPYEAMKELGFSRRVVVLTRPRGYRKTAGAFWLPGTRYRKYPAFARALRLRFAHYNRQLRELERLEASGEIFVIRPSHPLAVGRTERSVEKIEEAYAQGRKDAFASLSALKNVIDL